MTGKCIYWLDAAAPVCTGYGHWTSECEVLKSKKPTYDSIHSQIRCDIFLMFAVPFWNLFFLFMYFVYFFCLVWNSFIFFILSSRTFLHNWNYRLNGVWHTFTWLFAGFCSYKIVLYIVIVIVWIIWDSLNPYKHRLTDHQPFSMLKLFNLQKTRKDSSLC